MGIYKRGTVYWYRWTGTDGKQQFTSLKTKDAKQAKKAAAKIEAELFAEHWIPDRPKDALLSDLIKIWLSPKKDTPSYAAARNHARGALAFFGDVKVSAITKMKMLKFIQHLEEKGLANATINDYATSLKSIWKQAEIHNIKHYKFDVYKKKRAKRREATLSQEQFEQLLKLLYPYQTDLKTVLLMSYHSAFRLGEMLALKKSDIDFEQGLVLLPYEITKSKKARYVPLHPRAIEHLKTLPDGRLITHGKTTLRTWFREHLKKLGIEGIVLHSLRHTAISNLRRQGLNLLTIAEISGHRDLKTLQRYSHHDVNDIKNIFNPS